MNPRPPVTGVLLDAAGTLLEPAEPVARTYWRMAQAEGPCRSVEEIGRRFGPAFHRHRARRDEDRGWLAYWGAVIAESTGCDAPGLVQKLWDHFAHEAAWSIAPGAEACCRALRSDGMRIGIVSNWDDRLRGLLGELGVLDWVDLVVVSAEEGVEKPDPAIFERACQRLGAPPNETVMVGDSRDDDIAGARAAGCQALLLGEDVEDFADLAARLATPAVRNTP